MGRRLEGSFLLAGAAYLLSACAQLRGDPAAHSPLGQRRVLIEVPFNSNRDDQCGPAALASVLQFWGTDAPPSALKNEIYSAALRGSLSVDLLLAARSRGMRAEMFSGSLARIKKELDAGHPMIAFVNLGFRMVPIGHFLVLTGYDDRRRALYAHSGARKNVLLPYKRFESDWEKTERWTLLILPRES